MFCRSLLTKIITETFKKIQNEAFFLLTQYTWFFLSFRFHLTVFTGVSAMTLFIIADGIVQNILISLTLMIFNLCIRCIHKNHKDASETLETPKENRSFPATFWSSKGKENFFLSGSAIFNIAGLRRVRVSQASGSLHQSHSSSSLLWSSSRWCCTPTKWSRTRGSASDEDFKL